MYYAREKAIKLETQKINYLVELIRFKYLLGEEETEKEIRRIRNSLKLIEGFIEDYEDTK